jgi:hypothetical protein
MNGNNTTYITDLIANIPTEESQQAYSQLAQLPECAYPKISIENRIKYLEWLKGELIMNEGQEKIAINIINSISSWREKQTFLVFITKDYCNILHFMKQMGGNYQKTFMIKVSQFLKEVPTTPRLQRGV